MCGIRSSQTDQHKYRKWPHEITHFHGKEHLAASSAKSHFLPVFIHVASTFRQIKCGEERRKLLN